MKTLLLFLLPVLLLATITAYFKKNQEDSLRRKILYLLKKFDAWQMMR